MRIYKFLVFCSILVLLIACSQQTGSVRSNDEFLSLHIPDHIYLDNHTRLSIDSVYIYHEYAHNSLAFRDTVGAKVYFEKIFNTTSNFSEETKNVLMEWPVYDSLMTAINNDYEKIFGQTAVEQEAEEILEDLTQYEESVLGDSSGISASDSLTDTLVTTIPLHINQRVELAIKYFQTKGRQVFSRWLERSGKYETLIKSILDEFQLPEELFFLAMIESGFNPTAHSYARAAGMWQFISATGQYYGLRNNWWFDERRDPILSTRAAAEHLSDLYDRFDDWYLAMAGYNCNPRKVESHIRRYNTRDFWQLKRLPRQTRNYVPTFIAATLIANNPRKYGFYVDKLQPVDYDTVHISECVDLDVIAGCVDTSFQAIKDLNPALLRWCTPPGVENFVLNLPKGSVDEFRKNYASIPDDQKRNYVRHRIGQGETLSTIAAKYGTSVSIIKSQNGLRGSTIRAGKYLVIPVPKNKQYYSYTSATATRSSYRSSTPKKRQKVSSLPGYKKVVYRVRSGDTLGEIAELYNIRASQIRSWNGLYYGQNIYPDQLLNIFITDPSAGSGESSDDNVSANAGQYYIVKSGDTLWDISRRYDVSIERLKLWNNKRTNQLQPGERLKVRESTGG
jgi:membrane-bound lytic murein transglycosylase D